MDLSYVLRTVAARWGCADCACGWATPFRVPPLLTAWPGLSRMPHAALQLKAWLIIGRLFSYLSWIQCALKGVT